MKPVDPFDRRVAFGYIWLHTVVLLSMTWFLLESLLYGFSQPSSIDTLVSICLSYFITDRILRAVWRS